MGNWDDVNRLTQIALIQSLVCPKCAEMNAPGHSNIEYDPHLKAAHCTVCSHCWCLTTAAT